MYLNVNFLDYYMFLMILMILLLLMMKSFLMILICFEYFLILILMMCLFKSSIIMNSDWVFLCILVLGVCESVMGLSLMILLNFSLGNQNVKMLNLMW